MVNEKNNEIFIVDKDILNYFFKKDNYEKAELFLIYLTTHCKNKKAYMIPCLFDEITKKIREKTIDNLSDQTENISYIENWIIRADFLGDDKEEQESDTLLLYNVLKALYHDDEVIIISDKYQNPLVSSLKVDSIWSYLMEKADFKEYIRKNYGLDDGASY